MSKRKIKTPKYVEQKLLEEHISGKKPDVLTEAKLKDKKKVKDKIALKFRGCEDSITLKHTGYVVRGMADLTLWGGGNACIVMKPFKLKKISKKALLANINDNGFGVESINGAICDIWKDYEGHLLFHKTIEVGTVSEYTLETYDEFDRTVGI